MQNMFEVDTFTSIFLGSTAMRNSHVGVTGFENTPTQAFFNHPTDIDTLSGFTLDLSRPDADFNVTFNGAPLATSSHTLTPTNQEVAAPSIVTSLTSLYVAEGATSSFTVALISRPFVDVTVKVTLSPSDTSESRLSSSSLTFTSADWDTPQAITVTGQGQYHLKSERLFLYEMQGATPL